jgi:hypothetical protein
MHALRFGPVALEHAQANGVVLRLQHGLDAGAVETNLEAAPARE